MSDTKASGRLAWPVPGKALNTWFGFAQKFCENRMVPYEIKNAPNVNASDIRKYHIISLPYSTLKGLRPPFHQFGFCCATAVVAIIQVWPISRSLPGGKRGRAIFINLSLKEPISFHLPIKLFQNLMFVYKRGLCAGGLPFGKVGMGFISK